MNEPPHGVRVLQIGRKKEKKEADEFLLFFLFVFLNRARAPNTDGTAISSDR